MISRYFSCQSIRDWPLMERSTRFDDLTPSMPLSRSVRHYWSFEKPQAEWIVMPLIRAAAVPDVAVPRRRFEISPPLLLFLGI
jgi:hypothetical protein